MSNRVSVSTLLILAFVVELWVVSVNADYKIGVGIADCTGPAAEVIFMGYAQLMQKGSGLHLRQFARAFIVDDGTNRITFVSVDVNMVGYGIKTAVLDRLIKSYGETYNTQNLIISSTHTHGGPGGFMQYFMYDVSVLGYVKQTFLALVDGITQAIINAHEGMTNGKIFLNSGTLLDANINRSPASYLLNSEEERAKYPYNVDKEMYQLKFVSSSTNEPIGLLNWFPVHPTSMNNTNTLISSDNVGYASILMEKFLNNGAFPGKGKVACAFSATNHGDVSPNIKGPKCINTGEPCDEVTSTCGGEAKYCIASGPGKDMFESTKIIGERLYGKALELLTDTNAREITGPVKTVHQFIDMPSQEVDYTVGNGTNIKGHGCLTAMGYSFAAGTTDGPGAFDFTQGTVTNNPLWDGIRDILAPPTPEDVACHAPKPILLATGQMKLPYEWQPRIVSTQLALIGDVVIAAVPGEFTTMSGRRLKNVVKDALVENGASDRVTVILAGLSNIYTNYISTFEEYQLQRYEGASTIFGPHTLAIYLSQYRKLATALIKEGTLDAGPTPPIPNEDKLISLVTPVVLDTPDLDNKFGTCLRQPAKSISAGQTVTAVFVSGHPRNNLMQGKTFLTVEKLQNGNWDVVATDAVWETRFKWSRTYLASSEVTIEWDVDENVQPGTYRIHHYGYFKSLFGGPFPYEGISNEFQVV